MELFVDGLCCLRHSGSLVPLLLHLLYVSLVRSLVLLLLLYCSLESSLYFFL